MEYAEYKLYKDGTLIGKSHGGFSLNATYLYNDPVKPFILNDDINIVAGEMYELRSNERKIKIIILKSEPFKGHHVIFTELTFKIQE